jgi:hypothetical protein
MLVWLLVLLLLVSLIYVVYKSKLKKSNHELRDRNEHHYTFKI